MRAFHVIAERVTVPGATCTLTGEVSNRQRAVLLALFMETWYERFQPQ